MSRALLALQRRRTTTRELGSSIGLQIATGVPISLSCGPCAELVKELMIAGPCGVLIAGAQGQHCHRIGLGHVPVGVPDS